MKKKKEGRREKDNNNMGRYLEKFYITFLHCVFIRDRWESKLFYSNIYIKFKIHRNACESVREDAQTRNVYAQRGNFAFVFLYLSL